LKHNPSPREKGISYPVTESWGRWGGPRPPRDSGWIELYNPADTPASTGGLFLTDDSTKMTKIGLPDTVILPGEYYLVWADEQRSQVSNHANFKLSAQEGEEIILCGSRGVLIDRIQFFATSGNPEARLPDVSYR